jgi:transaldolase/glucose-6-phosphate isomerase
MIKIPGTRECLPAIEEALAAGININVTLLFSVEAYEQVARAYIRALRRRADAGQPIDRIASVASFFVSRIDAEVDKRIDALLKTEVDSDRRILLEGLKGKVAIANAKNAYAVYQDLFEGPDFAPLKAKGAKVQRLLWASVGSKNPSYPDTLYIDELIGPETVSTMPPATYEAFKDHGNVRPSLTEDMAGARLVIDRLADVGIDFAEVTAQLLREGVGQLLRLVRQADERRPHQAPATPGRAQVGLTRGPGALFVPEGRSPVHPRRRHSAPPGTNPDAWWSRERTGTTESSYRIESRRGRIRAPSPPPVSASPSPHRLLAGDEGIRRCPRPCSIRFGSATR